MTTRTTDTDIITDIITAAITGTIAGTTVDITVDITETRSRFILNRCPAAREARRSAIE